MPAAGDPRAPGGPADRDDARRARSLRVVVHDRSMSPGLAPGDRLLVDPAAFVADPPRRGDVIVLHDPADTERLLIKRIVGVPGDLVRATRTGAVRPAAPSAGPPDDPDALEELEVPPGHVFVLSDRSARARDSRQFGPVPLASVVGRAWYRYGPFGRRGAL